MESETFFLGKTGKRSGEAGIWVGGGLVLDGGVGMGMDLILRFFFCFCLDFFVFVLFFRR